MKKLLLSATLILALGVNGQTAANWKVNDCSGQSRELFADLDAGKVAVLIWVMPCAACIEEALTVQTEVREALKTEPGKIVFYMADDYGNSTCNSLNAWAATNGITDPIILSSKTVSMNPYGAAGMPKVVIAAGTERKVIYNQNAPNITASGLRTALAEALSVLTGLSTQQREDVALAPNPVTGTFTLQIAASAGSCTIEVQDAAGKLVHRAQASGTFEYNTSHLHQGVYYVTVRSAGTSSTKKLVISR